MQVIDNHEAIGTEGGVRLSEASARDYFELLKPRVMSLVVFTGLAGMVMAPGHINPFIGFIAILCIAVGAGASGALNMWYDADIDAVMTRTAKRADPVWQDHGAGSAVVRHDAVCLFRLHSRHRRQLAVGRPARIHDLLLCGDLHDVAEALDAAEHRHRRCCRRFPADDRLGLRHQWYRHREHRALPHHLPVDASPFLGARPVQDA